MPVPSLLKISRSSLQDADQPLDTVPLHTIDQEEIGNSYTYTFVERVGCVLCMPCWCLKECAIG